VAKKTPEDSVEAARKRVLSATLATLANTGLAGIMVAGLLLGYLQPGPKLHGPSALTVSVVTSRLDAMSEHCAEVIAEAKTPEGTRCTSSMEVVDAQMRHLADLHRRHRRRMYDAWADLQEAVCARKWRRNQSRIEDKDEEDDI
jgi:hypothetical protein